MVSYQIHSMSNDSLVVLAAQGDFEARHTLAKRIRKLRGMGHNHSAKLLVAKERAQHAPTAVLPKFVREIY